MPAVIAVSFLAAWLAGLVAGFSPSGLLHDRRVRDLPGPAYLAMRRVRDRTFRRIMPALVLTLLGVLWLAALVTRGWPCGLFVLALFVVDAARTVRH